MRLSLTWTLSSYKLVLWTDGSVPFPFGKGGSGIPANCSPCGTKATLSFSAGPVCQVFLLKPASRCMLSAGLGSTLLLSFRPSFLLSQTLWQELSSLSSCYIRLQWVPGQSFPQGTTRLISWPDGERYLRPPQSLVVFLLLFLVSTLLFSRTVSFKFFDTQAPSISTEELVLPRHVRCVLSSL